MIKLEVRTRGLEEIDNVLKLDQELGTISDLRYKVDAENHRVLLELKQPSVTIAELETIFKNSGFEPEFSGDIPAEMAGKHKTERIDLEQS